MLEELIVAGQGGQGVMFLGILIAYSSMQEGLNVTFLPSYGAEMRGGTANCKVVISKETIGSPIVKNPSCLVVLNKCSLDKFHNQVKDNGLLILNSSLINEGFNKNGVEVIKIPLNDIARELGDSKVLNMVALGAYIKKRGIISLEIVINSLKTMLTELKRPHLFEVNEKALRSGVQYLSNI